MMSSELMPMRCATSARIARCLCSEAAAASKADAGPGARSRTSNSAPTSGPAHGFAAQPFEVAVLLPIINANTLS